MQHKVFESPSAVVRRLRVWCLDNGVYNHYTQWPQTLCCIKRYYCSVSVLPLPRV